MRAWSTSLDGAPRLREQVLSLLSSASQISADRTVDVHVMTFSFTDATIADVVAGLATGRPKARVRIIADWGQGAPVDGRQVRRLADLGLDNLTVRYKRDQLDHRDATTGPVALLEAPTVVPAPFGPARQRHGPSQLRAFEVPVGVSSSREPEATVPVDETGGEVRSGRFALHWPRIGRDVEVTPPPTC